jgi:3-hydroxyisobutyrate dehydrogenase
MGLQPSSGGPRGARGRVGLIGLGSLGLPIARNLVAAGYDVVGYRRRPDEAIVRAGVTLARSVGEVAERCTIVATCLPSEDALASVVSGPGGLASFASPSTVVVELSTLPRRAKLEQKQALLASGASMLDCAVSGNHRYVADRTAALFVSGDRADYDRCSGLLAAVTDHVTYVGPFGNGSILKLIASLLVPIHTLAAAEALALAKRAGIEPALAHEAIRGTQASSVMFDTRGAAMVAGDDTGPALADYHARNIVPALELAGAAGGDYPLLRAMAACYRQAIAADFGAFDQSAMFRFLLSGCESLHDATPESDETAERTGSRWRSC